MSRCTFCGIDVRPHDRGVFQRVTGWATRGVSDSRKGGSDIVLREPTGELACIVCINRLKVGVNPRQEALG